MNAVIGARPRFIAPGSIEELDGFEPLPERIAARRSLELTIELKDDGELVWLGDPVRAILTAYGFQHPSNVPDFPLSTGPTRWMASAEWAVDNPILMGGEPKREIDSLDRALAIARRLKILAGVDYVRVAPSQEARAARRAALRSAARNAAEGGTTTTSPDASWLPASEPPPTAAAWPALQPPPQHHHPITPIRKPPS